VYSKIDFLKGAFGIVPPELDGYETTLDLPAFDIAADIDPQWLLLFVTRQEFYRNQRGLARGGRKAPRVQAADFLKVGIPVPCKQEQESMAKVIGTLDRNIELLRQELAAVRRQKKGLIQKLLTGEVRVKAHQGGE
jgi:type I restriction enzyme S subunit